MLAYIYVCWLIAYYILSLLGLNSYRSLHGLGPGPGPAPSHVLGPLRGASAVGPPAPRTDGPAASAHGVGPGPGPALEGINSYSPQAQIIARAI